MDWSKVAFTLATKSYLHFKRARELEEIGDFHEALGRVIAGNILKDLSEALNFGVGHDEVNNECTTERV